MAKAKKTKKSKKKVCVSKRQTDINKFTAELPDKPQDINNIHELLYFLFPFLRASLSESAFRFLLGVISVHTILSVTEVAELAGSSASTIQKGREEVFSKTQPSLSEQRKEGAGRKTVSELRPDIEEAVKEFVRLRSYGPCTKEISEYTAATLASIQEFIQKKFSVHVSRTAIRGILRRNGIRLRTNKKLLYANQGKETGVQRTIRHLQFDYIDSVLQKAGDPKYILLSADCKKKENIGEFKATGASYSFEDDPVKANEHDFMTPLAKETLTGLDDLLDRQEGKAIPYGIYDISLNKGYVNVGMSTDTPEFVAESLNRFIDEIMADHPGAEKIYLLCDGGGSNNARSKVMKYYLSMVSKRIKLKIEVVHYPPYRSKFNKIERMVFAPISKKFERTPLRSLRTVLALIRNTTTSKGLVMRAELDDGAYEKGKSLSKEEIESFTVTYTGPTINSTTKLSYILDGSTMKETTWERRKSVLNEV